ncbi:hypothetical protein C8R48DRAFT_747364 [Suillus tomentosus]|nr:hypothetical protein C8R48DRAFT_747364 [Suillus tomentosus]
MDIRRREVQHMWNTSTSSWTGAACKKCRKLAWEKEGDDGVKVIIEEAAKKCTYAHYFCFVPYLTSQLHRTQGSQSIQMACGIIYSGFPNTDKSFYSHYDDANPEAQEPLPQLDDIKVDYHPHNQILSTIHYFADFSCTCPMEVSIPRNHAPWEPFRTRLDFEVAEIALEAALTAEQTNHLLSLVHRSTLRELWSTASQRFTPFQVNVVSVLYQNKVHEFDMHYHPLWEWALDMDMLRDRRLLLHFVSKATGFYFVCRQGKLSSFGTQKAYMIVCRIANLPVKIWNSTGWLPIVSEDPEHAGKSSFVNFKNAIWHESFLKLLESCADAIRHLLWPLILILSADYKKHAESEEALWLAHAKKSKKERERLLKTYLLCDIEVWFARSFYYLSYDALPRWSNLTHFSKVVVIYFNDSSHHEDISKMAIFAAQRILRRSQSKLGHLLLRCIHHYIDLDMYAGFEVHTEDTISAGRQALREFSALMEEYILKSQPVTGKNWNFSKKHASSHLFDDILVKGATQNFNTKPNEKMHSPVRDIYHNRTNFKDVATQVHTESPAISVAPAPCTHIKLGSAQGNISFASLEQSHADDRAFIGFQIKLNAFLNTFFPSNDITLPDGKHIHLQADNKITGYKYLQVNYESRVNWRQCKDLLRCNPDCSVGETNLSLALIHPYDVGIGVRSKHDADLGLWRVRAKPQSSPKFISVRSIIQGAALASDPGRQGDYFIINTVDADMFLRLKSLQA